jgi:glycyl-tRNA synthetase beta subunit
MMGLGKKVSEYDERKDMINHYVDNFWFIHVTDKQSNSVVRDKVYKLLDSIFKVHKVKSIDKEANNSLNESVNSVSAISQLQHRSQRNFFKENLLKRTESSTIENRIDKLDDSISKISQRGPREVSVENIS